MAAAFSFWIYVLSEPSTLLLVSVKRGVCVEGLNQVKKPEWSFGFVLRSAFLSEIRQITSLNKASYG